MTGKHPDPLGLYIHIPFCHARCGYCDFVTFTGKEDRIDEYVADLCSEIQLYSSPSAISTVFFGGGTPSVLEPRHLLLRSSLRGERRGGGARFGAWSCGRRRLRCGSGLRLLGAHCGGHHQEERPQYG